MKVSGNDPAFPIVNPANNEGHPGLPIRLEIAARILATEGPTIVTEGDVAEQLKYMRQRAQIALGYADALIAAHNETSEVKGE